LIVFVDASALVAMIAQEDDANVYKSAIREADEILWSAMSCWESISSLCFSRKFSVATARRAVEQVAGLGPFRLVPIDEAERSLALDAYEKYGKGSGHRAKLNMGDCFAYACAKINGARLLYKGSDFIHTDLA
jgi:ribonuclease VapC